MFFGKPIFFLLLLFIIPIVGGQVFVGDNPDEVIGVVILPPENLTGASGGGGGGGANDSLWEDTGSQLQPKSGVSTSVGIPGRLNLSSLGLCAGASPDGCANNTIGWSQVGNHWTFNVNGQNLFNIGVLVATGLATQVVTELIIQEGNETDPSIRALNKPTGMYFPSSGIGLTLDGIRVLFTNHSKTSLNSSELEFDPDLSSTKRIRFNHHALDSLDNVIESDPNRLRIRAPVSITLDTTEMNIGDGTNDPQCLGFNGTDFDSQFCWDSDTNPLLGGPQFQFGDDGATPVWIQQTNLHPFQTFAPYYWNNTFGTFDLYSEIKLDNVSLTTDAQVDINAVEPWTFNGSMNFTSGNDVCIEGGNCLSTVSGGSSGNPFDQVLNTTSNVTFDSLEIADLNVTGDFIFPSYLSVSTTAESTASDAEFNIFDEDNYGTFTYVNNSEQNEITFYPSTGQFEILKTGIYRFSINYLIDHQGSGSDNVAVIIKEEGSDIYNHQKAINTNIDGAITVDQIRTITANSNLTFHIDSQSTDTMSSEDGTTFTINRIS